MTRPVGDRSWRGLAGATMFIVAGMLPARGGPVATSGSYQITHQAFDAAGGISGSASYRQTGSAGGSAVAATSSGTTLARPGYIGQIYEALSLSISPQPAVIPESSSATFSATLGLDDGTTTTFSSGTWRVIAGPLLTISPQGIASSAAVYQDGSASIRLDADSLSAGRTIPITNVNPDDFGLYAGDGVDDAWQVSWFGLDNPLGIGEGDASATGQSNLFKWMAGLDPLDPASRFQVDIGKPANGSTVISFGPCLSDRRYIVLKSRDLVNWTPLPDDTVGGGVGGVVETLTVTDTSAATGSFFYRIEVEWP